jgi:hypothetical protein
MVKGLYYCPSVGAGSGLEIGAGSGAGAGSTTGGVTGSGFGGVTSTTGSTGGVVGVCSGVFVVSVLG